VSRAPLLLLTGVLAVDQADRYLLSAVFPLLKDDFRLSDAALGSLSAAFLLVATLGAVPFGVLVDRVTRTKVAAWGAALWSLAMVLTGLASSYGGLFAARMGLGVAESSYTPASFSLLTDLYPVERRSRVLGLFQVGAVVGFLGLPLGGLVADRWGWRAAFHLFALPGFVLAVLLWRLPEPPRGDSDRRHLGVTAATGGFAELPARQAVLHVLRIRSFTTSVLASSLAVFFTSGLGIWATTFLVRYHGLSLPQATAATSLLAIGAITGMLLGGRLGDRLVLNGRAAGRLEVAVGAQVAGVLLLFPAFAVTSTPLMLVLFGLGAVTLTMPNAPLAALRADVLHPDLRGRAASVGALLSAGAAAASPLVIGLLSDAFSLRAALLVLLPAMAVGGIWLGWLGGARVSRDVARMQAELREGQP
jgi:MFS family permease